MIKNLLFSQCDSKLKLTLKALTLHGSSLMRDTLATVELCNNFDPELFVFKKNNKVIAWAMITYDKWYFRNYSNDNPIVMIYVDPNFRRMKIGTKLINEIKLKYPKIRSQPWDNISKAFYVYHDVITYWGSHPISLGYF